MERLTENWRNDPATEKQLKYIFEMQEFSYIPLPPFTGTTKGEASDYIKKHHKTAHGDWNIIAKLGRYS